MWLDKTCTHIYQLHKIIGFIQDFNKNYQSKLEDSINNF